MATIGEPRNISSKGTLRPPKCPYILDPLTLFYLAATIHSISALYSPIHDCDEVYNYWEPAHYMLYGYGRQTWEYAPAFALRSWSYITLHVLPILPLAPFLSKSSTFYTTRFLLGLACAASETRLYAATSRVLGARIGLLLALSLISATGTAHASVAFLPSSFAMDAGMWGAAAFMEWDRKGLGTAAGIMWFGIGAVVGWPFSGAMVLPFLAEEGVLVRFMPRDAVAAAAGRFTDGAMRVFVVLLVVSVGDWFFYRYWTIVAYNIVKYNVFSTAGSGPNIFGTEPWHFYLQNLLLNFNLWFLLALAALPLSLLNYLSSSPSRSELRQMPAGPLRALLFQTPFYLWLLLLSAQPHKEERFMYPVYPFLALNAAISAHILLAYLGSRTHASLFGRCLSYLPAKLRLTLAALPLLLAIDFSLLRTVGLITAYGAPLQIYAPLSDPTIALAGTSVCLAKEWHRFPSSFFLPGRTLRAKFAPSNFDGLLPAEFHEGRGAGFGFFAGAYLEPAGMNGENRAFAGHVLDDVRRCDFLIDSRFPSVAPTEREPDYAADGERWEKIVCKPYLDAWATSLLGRLVWVPDWKGLPEGWRRRWGEYCLLRRRIG